MEKEVFRFHTHGCEVYGFHMQPETVKGVVVLVHGFGEHSGRYTGSIIPMLISSHLAVVTYDNVGHGKSSGKRGHCPSYVALLDILRDSIDIAEGVFPNLPLFLYGHSMGGNLVLNYALRRETQLTGIVATSPYLRLAFQPPKWKMFIGRRMQGMAITLPSGLDPKGISRIPEEVEKYKKDPLIHDRVSPMFSFPIMDAGEWAIENANQLSVNTLLLHGTADPVIDYKGTEAFHQNSSTTTLNLIEGAYHELHHDLCQGEMMNSISCWFKERQA